MLDTFWTLAGYPDGTLGADEKVAFYKSQGAVGDSLGDLEYDYWYRIGPNLLAAKGAVFAIDAAQSINGEQWVLNRGSGGQVLRAKYGSVGRAEIRNGVGLINVGRVSGSSVVNYAATPHSAAMYSPNELEVVVRVSLDNWATYADTASMAIIGRADSTPANNSFNVSLIQTTRLVMFGLSDGSSYLTTASSVAVPFSDGQMVWLKVTWRKSDGRVQFWWASDQTSEPSSWTQLGIDRTLASGISMNTAGTDDLRFMGCPGASYYGNGVMARAILRTAIGGANALDVDFAAQPDLVSSFVASTGQTVTVTAVNAVDTNDPLWLPWNGENYVHLPSGSSSNNIIVTAAGGGNAIVPTGDLELVFKARTDKWAGAATTIILGQHTDFADPSRVWTAAVLTNGFPRFQLYPTGSVGSVITCDADAPLPFADKAVGWLRFRFTANDGSGNRRFSYWTCADQPTEPTAGQWTQLGSEVVTAGTVTWSAITGAPLYFGANSQHAQALITSDSFCVRRLVAPQPSNGSRPRRSQPSQMSLATLGMARLAVSRFWPQDCCRHPPDLAVWHRRLHGGGRQRPARLRVVGRFHDRRRLPHVEPGRHAGTDRSQEGHTLFASVQRRLAFRPQHGSDVTVDISPRRHHDVPGRPEPECGWGDGCFNWHPIWAGEVARRLHEQHDHLVRVR
jgi:hypothetical protein